MKKLIATVFVVLTMLNCKNKEQKTETIHTDPQKVIAKKTTALDLGCYVFDDGKNIVSMKIIKNGEEIKGNLTYALFEKDKNSGKFTGKIKEGILIADYTFLSEGKESIRQIAFKAEGDKLIEGYGELNNESTAFKDIRNIQFTSTMPLIKRDCNK